MPGWVGEARVDSIENEFAEEGEVVGNGGTVREVQRHAGREDGRGGWMLGGGTDGE